MKPGSYRISERALAPGELLDIAVAGQGMILFVDVGKCEILVKDRAFRLTDGDFLLLGGEEDARLWAINASRLCAARFSMAALDDISPELTAPLQPESLARRRCFLSSERYIPLVRMLLRRLGESAPDAFADALYRKSVTAMIFIYIGRALAQAKPERPHGTRRLQIDAVCAYIEAHLGERLTLDVLAGALYFDKFYVSHAFRARMGVPLHRYIAKRRLDRARELLAQGESVAQVGTRCGFSSASHFIASFKAEYGTTPAQFARGQAKINQ